MIDEPVENKKDSVSIGAATHRLHLGRRQLRPRVGKRRPAVGERVLRPARLPQGAQLLCDRLRQQSCFVRPVGTTGRAGFRLVGRVLQGPFSVNQHRGLQ